MSNPYAIPEELVQLQQVSCKAHSLAVLGSDVCKIKWHADLLDDQGDPCGRMCLGVDSALPAHADFRWSCQLNCHFNSLKYQDGPMCCGIGDTPQAAYEAALAHFERSGLIGHAALFRRFNHG